MRTVDECLSALFDLSYMVEGGAIGRKDKLLALEAFPLAGSDQGHFEALYRHGKVPMAKLARWASRLRLEDSVRSLVEKGVVRFEDALAYFCQEPDPTLKGLVEFLVDEEGEPRGEASVRAKGRKELTRLVAGLHTIRARNKRRSARTRRTARAGSAA